MCLLDYRQDFQINIQMNTLLQSIRFTKTHPNGVEKPVYKLHYLTKT